MRHAALHQLARLGELTRHVSERSRQAAELVARGEHRLGAQVALRDLAHAFGQQQQRPRKLVRQGHREQQRAEHREDQRQRQRADVHLAQPFAAELAQLVFAVGRLHRQRVRGQRRRQQLRDEQVAVLLRQLEVAARHVGECADSCAAGGGVFFQPFELAHDTRIARGAQQQRRRPLGHQAAGRAAGRRDDLPTGADDRHVLRRQLLAKPLERERLHVDAAVGAALAEALGCEARLRGEVVDLRVECCAAEVQAGIERALDLHVEPAFDAACDELEAHRVDQHAGNHADQREDRRELEQQAAAELAVPHPQQQARRGRADHQHEERGDRHVDPEQPDVVALVERAVVGGNREQERQHQDRAGDGHQRDDPGPAIGFGHVA